METALATVPVVSAVDGQTEYQEGKRAHEFEGGKVFIIIPFIALIAFIAHLSGGLHMGI